MSVKIEQTGYDVNVDTNGFDISIATPGPQGPPGPAGEDGASAVSSVNGMTGDIEINNISGNAGTASKLLNSHTINGVGFDGSGNITVTADANTLTGTSLNPGVVNSSLTSVGTLVGLTIYNPTPGQITTLAIRSQNNAITGTSQPLISIRNASNTQVGGWRADGLIFTSQIGTLDDSTATIVDASIANSTIPAGLCLGFGARITWSSYTWWFAKDLGISRVNPGVLGVGDSAYGAANAAILCKRLVEANTAVAASPNVITAHEGRTVFTNEGSTAKNYHTLPTAVAGYDEEFIVQDSDGMRITAASGDTIRIESSVSAAGGYIESTVVGSTIRLVSINATEWIATAKMGTWTVT